MSGFGARDGRKVFEVLSGVGVHWYELDRLRMSLHASDRWVGPSTSLLPHGTDIVFNYDGAGNEDAMQITDSWAAQGLSRAVGRGVRGSRRCSLAPLCKQYCRASQQYMAWMNTCDGTG